MEMGIHPLLNLLPLIEEGRIKVGVRV